MGARKMLVVVFALVLVAGFSKPASSEGLRIAVVDGSKVMSECDAGKAGMKMMDERYQELKKQVEAKQDEARKMKEDLDKQKIILGKEKLKEKEDELGAKVKELQQLAQESENEMQTRLRELNKELVKKIEAIIDRIVAEEKLDLLLDSSKGAIIHFNPAFDVTAKVIERVNVETKAGKDAGGVTDAKQGKEKKEAPVAK